MQTIDHCLSKVSKIVGCSIALVALSLAACGDDDAGIDGGQPDPDFYACESNSDCIVVPESCCGTCGAPTRGDAVAINIAMQSQHAQEVCGEQMGCPACAPLFDDPTLLATCRAGRCELVDWRNHSGSACQRDADCKLRTPDCCECGGDTSMGRLLGVGVDAEQDYTALVCDPDQACDACAPIYPKEVSVSCNASKHCETHDTRLP